MESEEGGDEELRRQHAERQARLERAARLRASLAAPASAPACRSAVTGFVTVRKVRSDLAAECDRESVRRVWSTISSPKKLDFSWSSF